MRTKFFAFAAAAALGGVVSSIGAQAPSAAWKAKNVHDDRYEGVGYQRNVSTFGLNLISLLALTDPDTRAAIDVTRDDEIVVDFHARAQSPYVLIARELVLSEYYWMEPLKPPVAVPGSNKFIWKTNVLRELKSNGSRLSISNMGVLISFGRDAGIDQVAAAIVRSPNAKPSQTITGYRATFLPDTSFDKVSFSVGPGCQISDIAKAFPGGGSVGKQYPATSFPVNMKIPADYTGPVMLEITTTRLVAGKPAPADVEKVPPAKIEKSRYCFVHSSASR